MTRPFEIRVGDALAVLSGMPTDSVHCVVTSPPYWGLRDYGAPGQIGLEASFPEFLARLVAVFEEVRRVLRRDGTLWLNMGDSYSDRRRGGIGHRSTLGGSRRSQQESRSAQDAALGVTRAGKTKDLLGQPWRLAFALQEAGWYLRSDIIWQKPAPMPESCRDRPTRSHEYLFLLTKRPRYHYDAEAIAEPVTGTANPRGAGVNPKSRRCVKPANWADDEGSHTSAEWSLRARDAVRAFNRKRQTDAKRDQAPTTVPSKEDQREAAGMRTSNRLGRGPGWRTRQNPSWSASVSGSLVETRNKRSVWTIASEPLKEDHFAAFPKALVEPCILAGCPPGGIVLDPFVGSGTTGIVALRHGRGFIGIELAAKYAALARKRIVADAPLFNRHCVASP